MRFLRFSLLICLLISGTVRGQNSGFTHDDTLRGSITPQRAWWDLAFYHLTVRVQPNDSTLSGSTLIRYRVIKPGQTLQVDLQRPMRVLRVEQDGEPLVVRQDGDAYFVTLTKLQQPGQTEAITVRYAGKPRVAKRPPWDGGLVWSHDKQGNWFIATACQGLGASAWWPCKDHMYDEPDSMAISVTVPDDLTDVSNGRLRRVTKNADHTRTFDWYVSNPINNYGVNLNIGRYEHWSEEYAGAKGPLSVDYYALPTHGDSARTQFRQVPLMLKAFEHWFGPYPFYEDGYKLVEAPYLGMEHQSSVTYGNGFRNGYLGRDLSRTGWGLLWDFIIVHESGHEWFASNNSWGGGGFSQALYDAVNRANTKNILFVAAAGNGGSDGVGDDNDRVASYPSNMDLPNVIAVAAITSSGGRSSFSNYGATTVDIGAPGSGIWSTTAFNGYSSYNGTSMATPHVTGAAALYAASHPGSTAAAIKNAILTSAVPTASLSGRTATGGRLDANAALSK